MMTQSRNEWDKLTKVIVGIADNAKIPTIDKSVWCVNYADRESILDIKQGPYPECVIKEANEDLERFCQILKNEGVDVLRPEATDCGYYNFCPRDSVIKWGEYTIAAPMPLSPRKNEYKAFAQHLDNVIDIDLNFTDGFYNEECIGNPNVLALHENLPMFDAANVLRANNDWLYLVSNSGNKAGAAYLQNLVGSEVKIHLLENVYSYMHIDSTVAFLREGLLLVNPSRIKSKDVLPKPFCDWTIIECPEPVDIGHYPNYCNSSPWVNMNLFSVNPNLVILEEHQVETAMLLNKYCIDSILLPMRHQRTLGGGFHCVTLDLERVSYYDCASHMG